MSSHPEPGHGPLVEHFVRAHGGWTALADELVRRIRLAGQVPPELEAARKGLRRLATRTGDGGQYARWLIRHFGVPPDLAARLRWIAMYHSRFGDLPASVRIDQLRLWDRPPITASRLVVWVHVGLASVLHRTGEAARGRERLAAAQRALGDAEPAAHLEVGMLQARVDSDAGQLEGAQTRLADLERWLVQVEPSVDAHCYRVRWVGQRAYLHTRRSQEAARFEEARAWFEAVPADTGVPFVDYRRSAGLAYQAWKLGDTAGARALAEAALEHAGDGGFVRFRVMALNLLARMHDPATAVALRARASRLAASIEDLHLQHVSERKPA